MGIMTLRDIAVINHAVTLIPFLYTGDMTKSLLKKYPPLLIALILILSVSGVLVLYGSLKSLTIAATERVVSSALGVRVKIESLSIDADHRRVTIENVTIFNPKGYDRTPALSFSRIDMDARSLQNGTLVFDDIRVTGSNIRLESGPHDTNLSTLRDQALGRLAHREGQKYSGIMLQVHHLVFSGVRLEPAVTKAIAQHLSPAVLPEIHMSLSAPEGQPLPAEEAAALVIKQLCNQALRRAAREGYLDHMTPEQQEAIGARLSLHEQMLEDARQALEKAPSDLKALKKGVGNTFKLNE